MNNPKPLQVFRLFLLYRKSPTIHFIVAPSALPPDGATFKSEIPAFDQAEAVFAVQSAVNRWIYENV